MSSQNLSVRERWNIRSFSLKGQFHTLIGDRALKHTIYSTGVLIGTWLNTVTFQKFACSCHLRSGPFFIASLC